MLSASGTLRGCFTPASEWGDVFMGKQFEKGEREFGLKF